MAGAGVLEGKTMPVRLRKRLVVGDNSGACQAMQEMGFDVSFIEYTQLKQRF
jgi:hypothetical protein